MTSHIKRLVEHGLINPPRWLPSNVMFEAMTGSYAYGCNEEGSSDIDLIGFAIPPKFVLFPHLTGHIHGFGAAPDNFEQYQQHHIHDKGTRKEYDLTVYSIVKFFELCRQNNPNMIDALFVPKRCVLHSTEIYEHVREHRKMFLSTNVVNRFRGYAFSQLSKLEKNKDATKKSERRQESIRQYGFDLKFAYHVVRLALECEQILTTGDLILDRDREIYKSIRRGEWTVERIKDWFDDMERKLHDQKEKSDLPYAPDEEALRSLLLECLEMHYGSLSEAVQDTSRHDRFVLELENVIGKYR